MGCSVGVELSSLVLSPVSFCFVLFSIVLFVFCWFVLLLSRTLSTSRRRLNYCLPVRYYYSYPHHLAQSAWWNFRSSSCPSQSVFEVTNSILIIPKARTWRTRTARYNTVRHVHVRTVQRRIYSIIFSGKNTLARGRASWYPRNMGGKEKSLGYEFFISTAGITASSLFLLISQISEYTSDRDGIGLFHTASHPAWEGWRERQKKKEGEEREKREEREKVRLSLNVEKW